MSYCFGCGSKFGLFKKEHSCKKCGRLHCNKCLTNKLVLPSSKVEQEVCKRCFDSVRNDVSAKSLNDSQGKGREVHEPPPPYPGGGATARKKLGQPEISTSRNDPDFEIRQRLDKLKEKEPEENVISEESVNEKFASLSGRNPTSAKSTDILTPRPKLTEEEEVRRLMEGAIAEANLEDSQPVDLAGKNDVKGLENRLLKLKGIDPESVKKSQAEDDSSEDEVEATAKVIQKALAEARIDEKVNADGYGKLVVGNENSIENNLQLPAVPCHAVSWKPSSKHSNPEEDEDGELPWCCICNEDASLRCHGCDDDLYCKRCYREGHTNFDMTDHQTSSFKARKKR